MTAPQMDPALAQKVEAIHEALAAIGWTRASLARQWGVPDRTMRNWLENPRGTNLPDTLLPWLLKVSAAIHRIKRPKGANQLPPHRRTSDDSPEMQEAFRKDREMRGEQAP